VERLCAAVMSGSDTTDNDAACLQINLGSFVISNNSNSFPCHDWLHRHGLLTAVSFLLNYFLFI